MGLAATTQSPLLAVSPQIVEYFHRRRWLEAVAVTAASGLVFATLMKLTYVLLFGNGIAVCWPMVGLTAGIMLKLPRRLWSWVLAGVAMGHLYLESIYPASEMLVDTVCDVAEVAIAAFALPAFKSLSHWMRQPNLLLRFIGLPVLLAPLLTSIPVGFVYADMLGHTFWTEAAKWLFADALGTVLWLPMALVLMSPETYSMFGWRALPKTVGLFGLLALVSAAIFYSRPIPLAFLIMPILLVVALKLKFSGSVLAVNMLSLLTAVATLHGLGPFMLFASDYRVMWLQVFLAACMLMCFPISIIMLDREAFEMELRNTCERMERLATNDALTGLANRRQFDTALEHEWRNAVRSGQTLGLLMIDADRFKLFNDCYGHVAGDECLRRIAETLARTVQRPGDLAGRYGGEEFFVLMPATDVAGALKVGEDIRQEIEAMNLEHRHNPCQVVTVSIGCCSMIPKLHTRPEKLVEAADQALYAAKQKGRNRVEPFEPMG